MVDDITFWILVIALIWFIDVTNSN